MYKKYLGITLMASSLYAANTSGYNVRAYYYYAPSHQLINNFHNLNQYSIYNSNSFLRQFRYNQCNVGDHAPGARNDECYRSYFDWNNRVFFDKNIEFYWKGYLPECHNARLSNQFLCEPVKRTGTSFGHRDPDGGPSFITEDIIRRSFQNKGQWKATWEGLVRLDNNLIAGIIYKRDWAKKYTNLRTVSRDDEIQAAIFTPELDWRSYWDLKLYKLRINDSSEFHQQEKIDDGQNYLYYPKITANTAWDNHRNDSPKRYGSVGYYAWGIPTLFTLNDIRSCAYGGKCPYVYLKLNYIPGSRVDGRGIYLTWRQKAYNNNVLYAAIPPEAFVPFEFVVRVVEKSYLQKYNGANFDINYVMKSPLKNKYSGKTGEYCLIEALRDTQHDVYLPYKANFNNRKEEKSYDIRAGLTENGKTTYKNLGVKAAFNNFPNISYGSCFNLPDDIKNKVGKVSFSFTYPNRIEYNHVFKTYNDFIIQPLGYRAKFYTDENKENLAQDNFSNSYNDRINKINSNKQNDLFSNNIDLVGGDTYYLEVDTLKYANNGAEITKLEDYEPNLNYPINNNINAYKSYNNGTRDIKGYDNGLKNNNVVIKGTLNEFKHNKPSPYLIPYIENNQICENIKKIKINAVNNQDYTHEFKANDALKYKLSLFDTKNQDRFFNQNDFGEFVKKILSGNQANDNEKRKYKSELTQYGYRCNLNPDIKKTFESKLGINNGNQIANADTDCVPDNISPAFATFKSKLEFTFNSIKSIDNNRNFLYSSIYTNKPNTTPNKYTTAVLDISISAKNKDGSIANNFDSKCSAGDIIFNLKYKDTDYLTDKIAKATKKQEIINRAKQLHNELNQYSFRKEEFKEGDPVFNSMKELMVNLGANITDSQSVIDNLTNLESLYNNYEKKLKGKINYPNTHKYIIFDENSLYTDEFKRLFNNNKYNYLFTNNNRTNILNINKKFLKFPDNLVNRSDIHTYKNSPNRYYKSNKKNDNEYSVHYEIPKDHFKHGTANIKIGIGFDKEIEKINFNPHNPFDVDVRNFSVDNFTHINANNSDINNGNNNANISFTYNNNDKEKYNKYSQSSNNITFINAKIYLNDENYTPSNSSDPRYRISGNAPSFSKPIKYLFYCQDCPDKYKSFKGESVAGQNNWYIIKTENTNDNLIITRINEDYEINNILISNKSSNNQIKSGVEQIMFTKNTNSNELLFPGHLNLSKRPWLIGIDLNFNETPFNIDKLINLDAYVLFKFNNRPNSTWGGKNLDVSGKNVKGSGKYIGNDVQVPYKNNKIGW